MVQGGEQSLRASPTDRRPQRERYQLQRVVRSNCDLEESVDDYDGRLNFLASVGVALLLSVVVIGFSGHDNGYMDVVQTASIVGPVTAQVK